MFTAGTPLPPELDRDTHPADLVFVPTSAC